MLDFAQFTTQDWIAVGSLAVSTLMLISNIVIAATTTMKKYAPGETLRRRSTLGPSLALRGMIDDGAYDGEYRLAARPWREDPDVIEIWRAAQAEWSQDEVVWFEDIVDWVETDAPPALCKERFMGLTGGKPDMLTAVLLNNGVFVALDGWLAKTNELQRRL